MVNVEDFKAHLRGMKAPEVPGAGDEPDSDESDGLSPGDQALKAIESGDGAALEEAIRRCVDTKY